jgi:TIR domain-containing protein
MEAPLWQFSHYTLPQVANSVKLGEMLDHRRDVVVVCADRREPYSFDLAKDAFKVSPKRPPVFVGLVRSKGEEEVLRAEGFNYILHEINDLGRYAAVIHQYLFPGSTELHPTGDCEVFLSYSTRDERRVREVCSDLAKASCAAYLAPDKLQAGDVWQDQLRLALAGAKLFVPFVSRNSINSHWVTLETGAAWVMHKRYQVCLLDDAKVPEPLDPRQASNEKGIVRAVLKALDEIKAQEGRTHGNGP